MSYLVMEVGLILESVRNVLSLFVSRGVPHCHFKSNENLAAAVSAFTDLDILFDIDRRDDVEDIVRSEGFVKFKAVGQRKYPNIEDYIFIDNETGRFVHIHAHYQLIGGESGVKPYRIPLEKWVLDSAVPDPVFGVMVPAPAQELWLLIIRAALKSRAPDYERWLRLKIIGYRRKLMEEAEFMWLKNKVSLDEMILASPFNRMNDSQVMALSEIYSKGMDFHRISRFSSCCSELFKDWVIINRYQVLSRRLNYIYVRVYRKFGLSFSKPNFRVLPGQGFVVAIVGPDGAGKSTQTKMLVKALRKKLDVNYVYMGSGDGKALWFRWPIKKALKLRVLIKRLNTRRKNAEESSSEIQGDISPRRRGFFLLVWAFFLALERKIKLKAIRKYKSEGGIVVTDRYPQVDVPGMNDGPLLQSYSVNSDGVLSRVSRWEFAIYDVKPECSPDLVIRLNADTAVLKDRRSSMDLERIKAKSELMSAIRYRHCSRDVEICHGLSIEDVHLEILKEVSKFMVLWGNGGAFHADN